MKLLRDNPVPTPSPPNPILESRKVRHQFLKYSTSRGQSTKPEGSLRGSARWAQLGSRFFLTRQLQEIPSLWGRGRAGAPGVINDAPNIQRPTLVSLTRYFLRTPVLAKEKRLCSSTCSANPSDMKVRSARTPMARFRNVSFWNQKDFGSASPALTVEN